MPMVHRPIHILCPGNATAQAGGSRTAMAGTRQIPGRRSTVSGTTSQLVDIWTIQNIVTAAGLMQMVPGTKPIQADTGVAMQRAGGIQIIRDGIQ